MNKKLSMEEFSDLYKYVDDKAKIRFLYQLLLQHKEFRNQFIEFFSEKEDEEVKDIKLLLSTIAEVKAEFMEELQSIDFKNVDWEDYVPPHNGYMPEWEAFDSMIEKEVDDVFDFAFPEIDNHLAEGMIVEGVVRLIGSYEACRDIDIQENSTYDDINEEFISRWITETETAQRVVVQVVKSDKQIKAALQLFFEKAAIDPEKFDFSYFEDFIVILIETKEIALFTEERIKEAKVPTAKIPKIVLHISKLKGDFRQWIEHAENNYVNNPEIARELLEYYRVKSRENFVKIARNVMNSMSDEFINYLVDNITADDDRELYIKILTYQVDKKEDIRLFYRLKEIISQDEINKFITRYSNRKPFYVELLKAEKRYEEILRIVKESEGEWYFDELINPVLSIYPEESFTIIKSRINKILQDERGRYIYQGICELLKLMRKIPDLQSSTQNFIKETYERKNPVLPALRDEMMKAGLIG